MQSVILVITVCVGLIIFSSDGLTIKKEVADNKLDLQTNLKHPSKKSVETLYSIEQDFNRGDGYAYYVPHKKFETPNLHNVGVGDDEEINQYLHSQVYHKPKTDHTIDPSAGLYQQQVLNQQKQEQQRLLYQQQQDALQSALSTNPLLAALFLSSTLGLPPAAASTRSFNHPAHLPVNPYVALLLSHYGRYIHPPIGRHQRGIYGYAAANNYHNNKPFGSYKIYEDQRK